MAYSVLILGATGNIGIKISKEIATLKSSFKRVAFLTATADAGPEKEAKYASVPLERIVGSFSESASYAGFDVVVSAVGDDLCAQQAQFIDAAFSGGVKHFYPTEFGADLENPVIGDEPYFVNKKATRKHLESKVANDPTVGYTYVMVGIFADLLFPPFNILGISEDRKTARFTGSKDAKITTTHGDDVAKLVAVSLLPKHLTTLSGRREVRLEGSTLTAASLFSTVGDVLGHAVDVTYLSKDDSYAFEKQQREAGNKAMAKYASLFRGIGFGGTELQGADNAKYPEVAPKTWADVAKVAFL